MDPTDKGLSEFVEIVKSWVPRRSEPLSLSRDFWMPDQSCRVCYECDAQFTVFNRRHHCRLCGRVFCAKCTCNSIPISPDDVKNVGEVGERIRVCNYCFKRWEQDLIAAVDNGIKEEVTSPVLLSPAPSTTSLVSSKSSGTGNGSTISVGSSPEIVRHGSYASASNPSPTIQIESTTDKLENTISKMGDSVDLRDPFPNQFGFCINRSDDEDEYDGHFDSETQRCETSNEYYGPVYFDEVDQGYQSDKVFTSNENTDAAQNLSAVWNSIEGHTSSNDNKIGEGIGNDSNYEGNTSSTIYRMESLDLPPVDFENNNLLWCPPGPEDEEDERESTLCDEDDDVDDATGEWGYLRSSNSFVSGEYRSRERSCDEHKKAMKFVVDGHFRALIAQLLQVENLPFGGEDDKESWLEIITSLSWEAATLLKPDTSKGGGMDPGGYVKVKCIASGHRCDSMVVKGVVCKKNVAHRRMSAKIIKPRFLILGGALEYQRVTNVLSSVDTLLQQEMDHLKMAVAKIDAYHPDVLLVEKSVSRFAQDYLLAKNISLVLNIKRPLLERIARCTGAQIVPSIDHLSSQKMGYCDFFHVEKYLEEHGNGPNGGQAGKKMIKTLMFFEGCPKPLGCTILLKGANVDELKKVKHVVQYGVFAAYHLALETSFLADEGASLPELPLKSPIAVALPNKPSSIDRSISTFSAYGNSPSSKSQATMTTDVLKPNKSVPMLTTVNFKDVMMTESSLTSPKRVDSEASLSASNINGCSVEKNRPKREGNELGSLEHHEAESVENNAQTIEKSCGLICIHEDNEQITERQSVLSELGISHQENNQKDAYELSREEFSTSDHQSILVSLSSRCIWKGTVCERSHLIRIKYYGNFDKPLGRYLRDNLFDQCYRCRSCDLPPEAHVHCYTHRQGSLTISVRQQDLRLSGERDGKIWMWHRCLKCPRIDGFPPATRRVVMSDAAWGLSFGKFLELSFSNNAAASRVASCGHSLHRDCLRFYGFGKMVACFRYAPISVHSVYLPPSKLDFNYQHQEWIQKEADEVARKTELLFTEILNKLHQLGSHNVGIVEPRSIIADLEEVLHKEKAEFEESLQKAMSKEVKKGYQVIDILEINKLQRELLFWSYYWDQRLIFVASFYYNRGLERRKDRLGSTDKLADLSLSPKPLKPYPALPSMTKIDEPRKEERDSEEDNFKLKQSKASSINSSEQLDTQEYSIRRVLSEGQCQVITDLSDTLDAKWTGENGPTTLAEVDIPKTLTTAEVLSVSSDPAVNSATDVSKSLSTAPHTRPGNCLEDFPSWIEVPFLNFYRSMSKDGNAQKVEALKEYNPVHISIFRELESQGGARLLLPVGVDDTVIPVYDDELTSIISYALISSDYHSQMSDEKDRLKESGVSSLLLATHDSGKFHPLQPGDDTSLEFLKSVGSTDASWLSLSSGKSALMMDPLAYTKALHIRVSFSGDGSVGKVKYTVTCYYAKCFDALRRICCPTEVDFIRSLSRCKQWGAQGGKSNVLFAKSLDERLIIKQVTKTELESFIKFGPEYFKYLSESISTGSPTCLAKILGIYQITTKHMKGGKESKIDVLVMENLLFGRNVTRLYDLKGSARSRYNADSGGKNKVLLDQNLIEAMPTSPIFVGNQAKRLLERAVWNDTAFLALVDVMDYSLLVGVDEENHELVLGIIDFMRQYTWDKHLETWVKTAGILGGSKNESPTVISPKQYKKRFRKAMSTYFLVVPDQWSPSTVLPSNSQPEHREDSQIAVKKL